MLSTSSSHEHSPPQLTTSNYNQWARDMKQFLNRHGLGLIITKQWVEPRPADAVKPTAEERKEVLQFKQAQSKAAGLLWQAVPKEQQVHLDSLKDLDDALAIWDKLKEVFVKQNSTSRFTALDVLLRVQLQEGEGLVDLAARTTRLHNDLGSLLPANYKVETLMDDLEVNALLNATRLILGFFTVKKWGKSQR